LSGTITPTLSPVSESSVGQPRPDPFWPLKGVPLSLDIAVAIPGQVTVKAFDLTGRLVKVVADFEANNGPNTVTWDGRNQQGDTVASGLYLLLVEAPGLNERRLCGVLK